MAVALQPLSEQVIVIAGAYFTGGLYDERLT
jgi:hypothetical protein